MKYTSRMTYGLKKSIFDNIKVNIIVGIFNHQDESKGRKSSIYRKRKRL